MDFIYFLGRFHVLVLHIPLGIIIALFVLELIARREKYRHLEAASPFLWMAAAVSAVVTEPIQAALLALHDAGHPVALVAVAEVDRRPSINLPPSIPVYFVTPHWNELNSLELD